MGLGQAMLFLPSISVVSHHFKRRRAMATGVAVSVCFWLWSWYVFSELSFEGASVGGIVWPIILNQTSQRLNFPTAIRITAAIIGVFLLIANSIYSVACSKCRKTSSKPDKPDFRAIFSDWAYLVSIASWVHLYHKIQAFDRRSLYVDSAFCINLGLFFPCEFHNFNSLIIYRCWNPKVFYLQSYALTEGLGLSFAFYLVSVNYSAPTICFSWTSNFSLLFWMWAASSGVSSLTFLRISLAHTICSFHLSISPRPSYLLCLAYEVPPVWQSLHCFMGFGRARVSQVSETSTLLWHAKSKG
jgi:hypothetical protein